MSTKKVPGTRSLEHQVVILIANIYLGGGQREK